jgi:DNA-binding transcriptional ArsR family regulator
MTRRRPKVRKTTIVGKRRPLKTIIDPKLVKALSHPLRADLLSTLSERVASPRELAEEIGLEVSDVSYHVRELRKSKCIELVRTRRRRGAVEHFYRASTGYLFDDYEWERLPETVRPGISAGLVNLIVEEVGEALRSEAFEARCDRHLSHTPVMVDEQGWSDLIEAMEGTLRRVVEIRAESIARIERDEAPGFGATVAMLGFARAPEAA